MKLLLGTLALCMVGCFGAASAQQPVYPARPVKLVVPVPPGGLQDTLARGLAQEISRAWAHPIVVENRAGASGVIAATYVSKAPPDGYTLMMSDNVTLMTNHLLRKNVPYDLFRDFAPVVCLVQAGNILVVEAQSPARSLQQLIALARAKPQAMNYGSFGPGSSAHIDTEALAAAAGFKATHIPYKGGAELLQGLLGGQLSFSITGLSPALPLIRQGRLRALAYGGLKRSPLLPETPTISESAVSGFESSAWFGWLAPAGTSRGVLERIAEEAARAVLTPAIHGKYVAGGGFEVLNRGPAAFEELLRADRDRYVGMLKSIDVRLD